MLGDTGPRGSVGLLLLVTLGQAAGQTVLANLARLGRLRAGWRARDGGRTDSLRWPRPAGGARE